MSSSESSSNTSGSYNVGLSTARFLDQAMLEETAPIVSAPAHPRPVAPPSPPPAPAPVSRSESDEDVNSYMQQLLKRTGAQPPAPAAPKATPAPVWETKPAPVAAPPSSPASDNSAESNPTPTEAEPWSTENYIPKKQAPEREADLRAFRQLANASARGAVNNFQEKKQRKQCTLSGLLAGGALIAAAPLLWLSSSWGDPWSLAALGSVGLGIAFGIRFNKSRAILPKRG